MIQSSEIASMLAYGGATGAGLAIGLQFMKWLLTFMAGRYDKHHETIDAGTQKLLENLNKRLDAVSDRLSKAELDLDQCKEEHAKSRAEVMQLRAQLQGYGDARQHAALIVASEREKDHEHDRSTETDVRRSKASGQRQRPD